MRSSLYVTLLLSFLSLTLATLSYPHHPGIFRRDICSDHNEVDCDSSCMPAGSVCCNLGTGVYCYSGNYCGSGGCCEDGKVCVGPNAGTETVGSSPTATSTPKGNSGSSTGFGQASISQLYALLLVAAGQLVLG
jgi:hypothetical protein